MPRYSIIIPTYNAAVTLAALLKSLEIQTMNDFEIIVVDDASTDDTSQIVENFAVIYQKQEARRGPAAARNRGAELAQGQWLVFADADTVFAADTLEKINDALQQCEMDALVGTYSGKPANSGFMPRYKGLWEEIAIDGVLGLSGGKYIPYTTWAPRPGVVRKDVFNAVGRFNESFRGADLEDIDLGYRMAAQGYRIFFVPDVRIKHHYPATFWKEIRAFARRCSLWMQMDRRNAVFDKAGEGTPRQALVHINGFMAFILFVFSFFSLWLLIPAFSMLLFYLFASKKFLLHVWHEEGLCFALRATVIYWIHTIVLGFAAGYGLMRRFLDKIL